MTNLCVLHNGYEYMVADVNSKDGRIVKEHGIYKTNDLAQDLMLQIIKERGQEVKGHVYLSE